jgi:hypothetical protein
MQEAKDSSAIENVVTTHDELFKDNALSAGGFVEKRKIGRSNYYINLALHPILTGPAMGG